MIRAPRQNAAVQLPVFHIDAFTDRVFGGNPAAVVPLSAWLPDAVMQSMAMEHQLSETAFLVPRVGGPEGVRADEPTYDLRWFTPTKEVDLCGHATLASGWLVLRELTPDATRVHFHTRSGWLSVGEGAEGRLTMDLPSNPAERTEVPHGAADALGGHVVAAWRSGDNVMLVVDDEATVAAFRGDPAVTRAWSPHLVIVTAPAADPTSGVDFVSRVFAPGAGVNEDPVTGSAHTILAPYWSARLNSARTRARQISARGGDLWLEHRGERVAIEGDAVLYATGLVHLPG
jgi:PhzF family phenazine biosynthesis protein